MEYVKPIALSILAICYSVVSSCKSYQTDKSERVTTVFLIGVDGMSVDGLTKASTPNMDLLMAEGASSLKARGVMPTSSGPNWGSMLLGAGPEQHGILSNAWRVNKYTMEATVKDEQGFFPSVFDVIKAKDPSANLAVFHEWGTIKELFNNKSVNKIKKTDNMNETLNTAFHYFTEFSPRFVFLHLDAVDHAGHKFGHGSKEYYDEIELIDTAISNFIEKLKAEGKYNDVHIIITSDHGGVGTGHGGSTMAEIEIPWIIIGPNVVKGKKIEATINTYDTPTTIAWLLGAENEIPQAWIGRPVISAFE